jgi:hypothetical protein
LIEKPPPNSGGLDASVVARFFFLSIASRPHIRANIGEIARSRLPSSAPTWRSQSTGQSSMASMTTLKRREPTADRSTARQQQISFVPASFMLPFALLLAFSF